MRPTVRPPVFDTAPSEFTSQAGPIPTGGGTGLSTPANRVPQKGSDIYPDRVEFDEREIQTDPILRHFRYAHLPSMLQRVSQPFCSLARFIVDRIPANEERSVALRKLLEAKDAAVRANVL
jgi:hypothetical protein